MENLQLRLEAQDARDSTEDRHLKEEVSRLKDLPAQAESRKGKTLKLQEDASSSKKRELEKKTQNLGRIKFSLELKGRVLEERFSRLQTSHR